MSSNNLNEMNNIEKSLTVDFVILRPVSVGLTILTLVHYLYSSEKLSIKIYQLQQYKPVTVCTIFIKCKINGAQLAINKD